jgi:hypothetical protein
MQIYEVELDLGTVTIEGVRVPFSMIVYDDGRAVSARVELGSAYPNTAWRRSSHAIIVRIGLARETLEEAVDYPEALLAIKKEFRMRRTTPVLFLKKFYGINPQSRHLMTNSENKALRGIARRAMCALLPLLASRTIGNDTLVVLEASGEVPHALASNDIRTNRNARSVRRSIVRNIRGATEQHEVRAAALAQLRNFAGFRTAQLELERMYTRSFGFRPFWTVGVQHTIMAGWLSEALARCKR